MTHDNDTGNRTSRNVADKRIAQRLLSEVSAYDSQRLVANLAEEEPLLFRRLVGALDGTDESPVAYDKGGIRGSGTKRPADRLTIIPGPDVRDQELLERFNARMDKIVTAFVDAGVLSPSKIFPDSVSADTSTSADDSDSAGETAAAGDSEEGPSQPADVDGEDLTAEYRRLRADLRWAADGLVRLGYHVSTKVVATHATESAVGQMEEVAAPADEPEPYIEEDAWSKVKSPAYAAKLAAVDAEAAAEVEQDRESAAWMFGQRARAAAHTDALRHLHDVFCTSTVRKSTRDVAWWLFVHSPPLSLERVPGAAPADATVHDIGVRFGRGES